jgi:tyrosinase
MAVDSAAPPSRNDQVSQALLSKLPEIQQRLLILLANYNQDLNAIGKQTWTASTNLSQWDSIESIHDIVHIYGGSKGHMTYVPLSSFDPLFLLHHTMTDRLVAMWQLLYPDSWITAAPAGETSYTALKGDMQDSKTALTPFYASNDGTFWDSDMARTTEAFGYTYADVDISFRNEQDVREELTKKVSEWYGTSITPGQRRLRFTGGTLDVDGMGKGPPKSTIFSEERYTDWVAKVRVNDWAVGDNFMIYFFLGDAPRQTKDWMLAENVLSSLAVMGPMPGTVDRKHGRDSGTMVTGVAPLGDGLEKLMAAGEIVGLHAEAVEPFLREKLQVRVMILNRDNEEVKPEEVAGLYVSICSSEITMIEKGGTGTPKFGELVERMQMKFWQDDDIV